MPESKGMYPFKGEQHHSSRHPGPDRYKGKQPRRDRLYIFCALHLARRAIRGRGLGDHGAALYHQDRVFALPVEINNHSLF